MNLVTTRTLDKPIRVSPDDTLSVSYNGEELISHTGFSKEVVVRKVKIYETDNGIAIHLDT